MRSHALDDHACGVTGGDGVGLAVEVRGRQVLGPVERELAVAAQLARSVGQGSDVLSQRFRQAALLAQQNVGDVVDARRLDPGAAEQALEREFDDLLRLADDVGPAFLLDQGVEGPAAGPEDRRT